MAEHAPRNPFLGVVRLLALAWTLLSLLGVGAGLLVFLYAATWGCIGSASGWLACTGPWIVLPLASLSSLSVAGVVLFFSHLFYVAGVRSETVEFRRPKARNFLFDVIADILD